MVNMNKLLFSSKYLIILFILTVSFSSLHAIYVSFTPIALGYQENTESEDTTYNGNVRTKDRYLSYDASLFLGYKIGPVAIHASLGGYARLWPSISSNVAQVDSNALYTILRSLGLRFGGGITIYLPFTLFIRPNAYWATKLFFYHGFAADIALGSSLSFLKLFSLEIYVKYLFQRVYDTCNCTAFNTTYTDHVVNLGIGFKLR